MRKVASVGSSRKMRIGTVELSAPMSKLRRAGFDLRGVAIQLDVHGSKLEVRWREVKVRVCGAARESEASSSTARGGTRSGSKPQCYQADFENMGRGMER